MMTDCSLSLKLFLKCYSWRRIDPVPWTPLRKSLAQCRLALVSSAGLVLPHQGRFDESVRGGDPSFREIPSDADVSALVDSHRSAAFDHSGLNRDANLAFPIDRMKELVEMSRVGSVNHRHLSFMGSITAPGRLVKHWAPRATQLLLEDGVDVVLLVPVWPMCNQTVSLIAAEMERRGMATVVINLLREVAELVRPPRALFVPFRHGYPLDTPGDPERQHAVIEAALRLLEEPTLEPPVLSDFDGNFRARIQPSTPSLRRGARG